MLTIRGADQVCTSLRAARRSLGDYRETSGSRIEALDLIIGELAVGSKSYVGNPAKSKAEIERLVASLSQPPAHAAASNEGATTGDSAPDDQSPHMIAAMGHFRRAVATLQRVIAADAAVLQ